MLTPEDIERYKGHIASKERAREEKEHDKERVTKRDQIVFFLNGNWSVLLFLSCLSFGEHEVIQPLYTDFYSDLCNNQSIVLQRLKSLK
jgi:hypothetical protein